MTDLGVQPVDPGAPVAPQGPVDPFGGNSVLVTWGVDIQLAQLRDELQAALGPQIQVASYYPAPQPDGSATPVTAQTPLTLYVNPSSTDSTAVRNVLAAHQPNPYYGMTPDQVTAAQLKQKIQSGQTLTPEEIQLAFKLLVVGTS